MTVGSIFTSLPVFSHFSLSSPGQRLATGRFFMHWNAEPMAERSFSGYATTFKGWSYPNRLGLYRSLQRQIDKAARIASGQNLTHVDTHRAA